MVYERETAKARARERETGCWNICLPCTASNNSSLVHRELILFGGCETKKKIIVHQEAKHTEKVSREKTEHSSRDTWRRRKRESGGV